MRKDRQEKPRRLLKKDGGLKKTGEMQHPAEYTENRKDKKQ